MPNISGIAYPVRFGPLGHLETASGADKIEGNLRMITETSLRERLYGKDFGCLGYDALFKKMNNATFKMLERVLRRAYATHERRAIVQEINISGDSLKGEMYVDVGFSVRGTQEFSDFSVTVRGENG